MFGKKALMQQSIIPNYYNVINTSIPGEPIIQLEDGKVNYKWDNIEIGPMEAVIVAYANLRRWLESL